MTTNQNTHPTRVEPAQRRRFTKTEKHQIVTEYDAAVLGHRSNRSECGSIRLQFKLDS